MCHIEEQKKILLKNLKIKLEIPDKNVLESKKSKSMKKKKVFRIQISKRCLLNIIRNGYLLNEAKNCMNLSRHWKTNHLFSLLFLRI